MTDAMIRVFLMAMPALVCTGQQYYPAIQMVRVGDGFLVPVQARSFEKQNMALMRIKLGLVLCR